MRKNGTLRQNFMREGLTPHGIVVSCLQLTRQASVLRDMLNFGGFLFCGRGG